jgi:hypothetical protein
LITIGIDAETAGIRVFVAEYLFGDDGNGGSWLFVEEGGVNTTEGTGGSQDKGVCRFDLILVGIS